MQSIRDELHGTSVRNARKSRAPNRRKNRPRRRDRQGYTVLDPMRHANQNRLRKIQHSHSVYSEAVEEFEIGNYDKGRVNQVGEIIY